MFDANNKGTRTTQVLVQVFLVSARNKSFVFLDCWMMDPKFSLFTMKIYSYLRVDMTLIQHVKFFFISYQSHINAKFVSKISVAQ